MKPGRILSVVIPEIGQTFTVDANGVVAISKIDRGAIIFYKDDVFVEYNDTQCIFSGKTYTEKMNGIPSYNRI